MPIAQDSEGKKQLAVELFHRFHAMKTYGKEPESLDSIIEIFSRDLADFPIQKIMKAISIHSQRSQEFPTVSDIVGLIQRGGRPPLKESDIIAIRKKDGVDRTPEDWQMLRDWDKQQHEGWDGEPDEQKHRDLLRDNIQLRTKLKEIQVENRRLADMLHKERVSHNTEPPKPLLRQRINNTVAMMREQGATEEDIQQFIKESHSMEE